MNTVSGISPVDLVGFRSVRSVHLVRPRLHLPDQLPGHSTQHNHAEDQDAPQDVGALARRETSLCGGAITGGGTLPGLQHPGLRLF